MRREAAAGPLVDYQKGQRVLTREGYAGTVDDVLEGPGDLSTFWVTLDDGKGGGEYAEGELQPLSQTSGQLATVERTAADDYPELGTILSDRLPPPLRAQGSKEAGAYEEKVLAQHSERCIESQDEQASLENWVEAGNPDPWSFPPGPQLDKAFDAFQKFHRDSIAILLDSSPEEYCICGGHQASKQAAEASPTNVTIGQGNTVHRGYFVGENVTGSLCNPFAWQRSRVRVTDAEPNCPRCEKATVRAGEQASKEADQIAQRLSSDSSPVKVKRTATGIEVTTPDKVIPFGGGRAQNAAAVVVGKWDAEHGGGWNLSLHGTMDSALKAKNSRRFQTHVSVVPVEEEADHVAQRLALYLPPKAPEDQRSSIAPVSEQQQAGYKDGFAHGKEGITRAPARTEDTEYMVGYDIGWAEGVTVFREPANSWDTDELADDQIGGVLSDPISPMYSSKEAGIGDAIEDAADWWKSLPPGFHRFPDKTFFPMGLTTPEYGLFGPREDHTFKPGDRVNVHTHGGSWGDDPSPGSVVSIEGDEAIVTTDYAGAIQYTVPLDHLTPLKTASQSDHVFVEAGGLWDFVKGDPKPTKFYQDINTGFSFDWCRFRRNSHCWLPKDLNEVASKQAGYAVWNPVDRGPCMRIKWDAQKVCPTGQPGPHSGPGGFTDATVPWDEGGQRNGVPSGVYASKQASGETYYHVTTRNALESIRQHGLDNALSTTELWSNVDDWDDGVYLWKEKEKADDYAEMMKGMGTDPVVLKVDGAGLNVTPDRTGSSPVAGAWYVPSVPADRVHVVSNKQVTSNFEFTALWKDVRAKAKKIRSGGGVRIFAAQDNVIVGHVKGEHGVYETEIVREPGKYNAAAWHCGCKWSSYSWGRTGPWKRYEGRMCSHALALHYEIDARKMYGRTLTLDEKQPSWMDQKHVHRPGDWDKSNQRYTHKVATYHPQVDYVDDIAPTTLMASAMMSEGARYAEVREMLVTAGVEQPLAIIKQARQVSFKARVRGIIRNLLLKDDGHVYDAHTNEHVDHSEAKYPGYHPTIGLNPADRGKVGAKNDFQIEIQHDHQDAPLKNSFANPDTAIGWARRGYEAGATTARVVRKSDGKVIYDGPAGIELPIDEHHNKQAAFGDDPSYEFEPETVWAGSSGLESQPSFRDAMEALPEAWSAIDKMLAITPVMEKTLTTDEDVMPLGWGDVVEAREDLGLSPLAARLAAAHQSAYFTEADMVAAWLESPEAQSGMTAEQALAQVYHQQEPDLFPAVEAKKKDEGPTVSGVVLKAADTGRILMLQRSIGDKKDPAAGTWEFPGGHHEDGDTTSLHAGIREWQEEVGQTFPEGGVVHHVWHSPNGVYAGHLIVIPEEKSVVLHEGRSEDNPDDPDGDDSEQVAWWEVDHAKKNPALRPEVKANTPWKQIADAAAKKTAAAQPGIYYHVSAYRNWASIRDNGLRDSAGVTWMWSDVGQALHFSDSYSNSQVPPCVVVVKTDRAHLDPSGVWGQGAYQVDGPVTKDEIYDVIRPEDLHYYQDELDAFRSRSIKHGTLTKHADEDQCPFCAGDSLVVQGNDLAWQGLGVHEPTYECDSGHVWRPSDPAAQRFHGDGPERGQIQPVAADRRGYHPTFIMGNDNSTKVCVSCGKRLRMNDRYSKVDDGVTHQGRCTTQYYEKQPTKEGSKMDVPDQFGSLFDEADLPSQPHTAIHTRPLEEWGVEFGISTQATQHDEPEPALPTTDGAEEDPDEVARRLGAALTTQAYTREDFGRTVQQTYDASRAQAASTNVTCWKCGQPVEDGQDLEMVAGKGIAHKTCPSQKSSAAYIPANETEEQKSIRLLAYADAVARGEQPPGPNPFEHVVAGQEDNELKRAASNFLSTKGGGIQTEAVKTYTPAERTAIIAEGEGEDGATNLDRLDITGTHYEALEQATAGSLESQAMSAELNGGRVVPEDEDMFFLSGDPNLSDV